MSELFAQLWTPQMQAAFTVVVVLLVILYVLSIVWVVRDAYLRGAAWYVWAVVALVPIVGVIAYCLLRPPMLRIDKDEQELEVALKQRQLMKYGWTTSCVPTATPSSRTSALTVRRPLSLLGRYAPIAPRP